MEMLVWRVRLADGSTFAEIDASGRAHGWAEVNHRQVVALEAWHNGVVGVIVLVPAWAEPVLFRRRYQGIMVAPAAVPSGYLFIGYRVDGLLFGRACYPSGAARVVQGVADAGP